MNTARNSSIGTCDSACSTLRIGMRQKISAKIAIVPRYGIALRQSGVGARRRDLVARRIARTGNRPGAHASLSLIAALPVSTCSPR